MTKMSAESGEQLLPSGDERGAVFNQPGTPPGTIERVTETGRLSLFKINGYISPINNSLLRKVNAQIFLLPTLNVWIF